MNKALLMSVLRVAILLLGALFQQVAEAYPAQGGASCSTAPCPYWSGGWAYNGHLTAMGACKESDAGYSKDEPNFFITTFYTVSDGPIVENAKETDIGRLTALSIRKT